MAYKKKSYKYVVLEVSNVFSSHKFGADLLLHIADLRYHSWVNAPGPRPTSLSSSFQTK